MKPYLILYDIRDDKQRNRIAKEIMKRGLHRVQKSVFLGSTEDQNLAELEELFTDYLDSPRSGPDDSYIIVPLTRFNLHHLKVYEKELKFDLDFYLGQKLIVFF
ncbi:MAG: CRISPR-associated endonuclease Cas2 [Chlorobi bacterium]|nr:CRISPR-associated endonuclease Cas2 [Chlorobiota bacterium]